MIKFLQKLFGRKQIKSTQEVNSISSNLPVSSSSSSVPEGEIELRWENKDEKEQIVECNRYIKGVYQGGVKVLYFTTEQTAEIERIKEEMRKKNCY